MQNSLGKSFLNQACVELILGLATTFSQALAFASTCSAYHNVFKQPFVFGCLCQKHASSFNLLRISFERGNAYLMQKIKRLELDVENAKVGTEKAVQAFKDAPGTAVVHDYAKLGEDVWTYSNARNDMLDLDHKKGKIVSTVEDNRSDVGVNFGLREMRFRCGKQNDYELQYSKY